SRYDESRRQVRDGRDGRRPDRAVQVVLLDVWQDGGAPAPTARRIGAATRWETAIGVMEGVESQPDLLQVVGALHAVGGLAHFFHGREQQTDEDANDGNDHK